jgi:hypothetical protein
MSLNCRQDWRWMPLLVAAALLFVDSAKAETRTVRIATQYGISYLPMTIMAERTCSKPRARNAGSILKPNGCASPEARP